MARRVLSIAVILYSALLHPLWAAQSAPAAPPEWATITGRVTDSDGRPVAGAKVSIFPLDVAVSGAVPRQPITDQEGRYRLVTPAYPGKSRLCVVKESAGYPDTQGLFFSSPTDNMPEITLAPSALIENVDIRLGPPDGVLDGSVVDSITGAPVSTARLTLHRDKPDSMYSATLPLDGHFSLALPAAPIQVSVTAPGYQRWSYMDPTGSPTLVLKSAEHENIIIKLTRKPETQ